MAHQKECPLKGFVYEIGSGMDIPNCTCPSDLFQNVLQIGDRVAVPAVCTNNGLFIGKIVKFTPTGVKVSVAIGKHKPYEVFRRYDAVIKDFRLPPVIFYDPAKEAS